MGDRPGRPQGAASFFAFGANYFFGRFLLFESSPNARREILSLYRSCCAFFRPRENIKKLQAFLRARIAQQMKVWRTQCARRCYSLRGSNPRLMAHRTDGYQKAPRSPREPQLATKKTPGELQKAPASCKKHRMMDRRVGAPEFRILIARPIRNANGSATGGRGYLVRMAQAEPLCTTIGAFWFADN